MAKKRKAKKSKIKRKRTAKKTNPQKSKAKRPPPPSNVDAQTPVASGEALEDAATASKFTGLCA